MYEATNLITKDYKNEAAAVSLWDSLNNALVSISFFGTRKISYEGSSISLDRVAKAVDKASKKAFKDENLTDEFNNTYTELRGRITKLYNQSNEELKTKNFITRFFVFLREDVLRMGAKRLYI